MAHMLHIEHRDGEIRIIESDDLDALRRCAVEIRDHEASKGRATLDIDGEFFFPRPSLLKRVYLRSDAPLLSGRRQSRHVNCKCGTA